MALSALLAFALTFFVFAASPGPDNFTIFTRTISVGVKAGLAYGLGTVTGILVFLTLGLAGLTYASEALAPYMVWVRFAGALYLVWMGAALWHAPSSDAPAAASHKATNATLLTTYATGVALNIGNPKVPLFYLAFLPKVAAGGVNFAGYLGLVSVILAIETVVISLYAGLALKARALAESGIVMRRLNRAAGALMAATGAVILSNR